MKTLADVNALLASRLEHVAVYGPQVKLTNLGLRLLAGDAVEASGWARRETHALAQGESPQRLAEFWLARWIAGDAERKRKELAQEQQRERERAQERWDIYGPPGKYARLDEDSFLAETKEQGEALATVLAFPRGGYDSDGNPTGDRRLNLMLCGTPGTGKTHLASIWLRDRIFEEGLDGQFITAAQLVREVRRAWDDRSVNETEVINRFGEIDALVIDDLGIDTSEGAVRILVEVLDLRLANEVHTCVTTNATPKELQDILGARGYSRLMGPTRVLRLRGKDQRLETILQ